MEFLQVLIYVGVTVFMIASVWKVFAKAGEPGWASIIPIYNTYVVLKIAGKPWWWLILMLILFWQPVSWLLWKHVLTQHFPSR